MTTCFALTLVILVIVSLLPCLTQSRDQVGAVLCEDGLASCPVHSSTCCLGMNNKYFCCPLPNAVCCADGIHCCPQCFSCNVKGGSCLRPAAAAAAVRIYSLVPPSDRRIHTPPPVPPAAAAVTAAARQREIEQNKAAALAQAIARKKAAEESEGFVSGVLSAVKLTLFSNGDDSKTKKSQQTISPPGSFSKGSKFQQAGSRPPQNVPLKAPALKPQTPVTPPKPQSSEISKSPGIMAHAQTVKPQGRVSPQATLTGSKQPTPVQRGGAGIKQEKAAESEKSSGGFFSSVLSAVTDFYSGGNKEEKKPADAAKPSPVSQHQKPTGQQHQKLAAERVSSQKPPPPSAGQISKSPQQHKSTPPNLQLARTQPPKMVNKPPPQVGKPQLSGQIKQQNLQGKQPVQAGFKQTQTGQQLNVKQSVGISQKSAAAAMATHEKKAKAWAPKQPQKL